MNCPKCGYVGYHFVDKREKSSKGGWLPRTSNKTICPKCKYEGTEYCKLSEK